MHIPDGYLSPATCGAFYAVMAPVWYIASKKSDGAATAKRLPFLSLGAAFSFIIMMFNVPVPGGTSGHMVGAVITAIILGPWQSVVALSLALALQAFFFADGGITTLGANAFNMAFLMSFAGWWTYAALAGKTPSAGRKAVSAGVAGYVGVNVTALATALELGVQPALAHDALGAPLYAPYGLSVTVPALMITHLLIFGPIEALGTALTVSYVSKITEGAVYKEQRPRLKPLWIILIALIALTPLGLIASGTPWGEWGKEELKILIGFTPSGMEALSGIWGGVMPGYAGFGKAFGKTAGYLISAVIGSVAVVILVYAWGSLWRRKK